VLLCGDKKFLFVNCWALLR